LVIAGRWRPTHATWARAKFRRVWPKWVD